MEFLSNIAPMTIWAILIVVFSVIEALTLGLTSIWFGFGAIVALFAAMIKLPVIAQIVIFLITSIILLIYTKPIAKKYLKIGSTKTNVEDLIGKKGFVVKPISNRELGQVKVKGQIWTAKSVDDTEIPESTEIEVVNIEGVKLIVKKANN